MRQALGIHEGDTIDVTQVEKLQRESQHRIPAIPGVKAAFTQQAIRRGTFGSVKDLVAKIDHYVQNSNRRARPFIGTATAESIFAKVERLCEGISGTAH